MSTNKALYVEIPPGDFNALTKHARRYRVSKKSLVLSAVTAYLGQDSTLEKLWGYHRSTDFAATIGKSLFEKITRHHPKRITSGKGSERYGLRGTFIGQIAFGLFESRFGEDILSHNDIFKMTRAIVGDEPHVQSVIRLINESTAERENHSNGGGECRVNFTDCSDTARINILRLIESVRAALGVAFNPARSVVFHCFLADVMDEYQTHKSMLFPPCPDDNFQPIERPTRVERGEPSGEKTLDMFERLSPEDDDEALKKAREVVKILEARRITQEQYR